MSNVGDATAINVTATVYISDYASVVSPGASIYIGTLVSGESEIVTWTLHCDSPYKSIVAIDATGIDLNTGEPIDPVPALWAEAYDGGYYDYANAVATDSNDNVIVTGGSYDAGGTDTNDYYTIKYDPNGTELWHAIYDSGYNDWAYGVAVDSNDNIIVTGVSQPSGADHDYFTIKYDPHGNILWTKSYDRGYGYEDEAYGVAVDSNDNVIVTGYSEDAAGDYDYCTIKYDQYGSVVAGWPQVYDGGYEDAATGVAVDSDDNVIVTGYSEDAGGDYDYYTIKYDQNGNVLWSKAYDWDFDDEANGVAVDLQDNIIVTGYSYNATGNNTYDYHTIKYDLQETGYGT